MTKEQAAKLAKPHAEKSKLIFVTEDGNVFFEPHKSNAEYHAKKNKIQLFTFTAEELKGQKKTKAEAKEAKEAEEKAAQDAIEAEAKEAQAAEINAALEADKEKTQEAFENPEVKTEQ